MPSVTIDAGVLAAPPETASPDEVQKYLDTLLDWSRLLKEPWFAIHMSSRANDSLCADGLYPLRDHLKRVLSATGNIEYDANTIARLAEKLLTHTPTLEDRFGVMDALTEDVVTEPDVLCFCSGELKVDLARCLVLLAIVHQFCQADMRQHTFILRRTSGKTVRVKTRVFYLEHQRLDLEEWDENKDFEGSVITCDDFRGLLDCIDEAVMLQEAADHTGLTAAIKVGLYKSRIAQHMEPEWGDSPKFHFGHSFHKSLMENHPTPTIAASTIRAILETLEAQNLRATHKLRTSDGGGAPQRERALDKAKAWRRDIDRDHHLHYWVRPDNTVELAWLSYPHDDFTIPE